jgi:hypothetical protein
LRIPRVLVLLPLLVLVLVAAPGASGLDICEEECPPPAAEQNTPYEFQFVGEEGCVPYRFSYLNGTVPPGLTITQDGRLVGTPTQAGEFDFWVGLDDNSGPHNPFCLVPSTQSQAHFEMLVMPDLAVTTESLPVGTPGRPYTFQLQFSNPEPGWPVVWDVVSGALPTGMTLSPAGLLSGTPGGPDRKTFTVRAREPFRRFGEKELTLTIATALQASASFPTAEIGRPYSAKVSASGGLPPYAYKLASGSLPAGLVLDEKTGVVRGKPTQAGIVAVTFSVTDASGRRADSPVRFRVAEKLAIGTSRLPLTRVGRSYAARLRTTGGVAPTRWQLRSGTLPRGIRLDPAAGTLSGAAREAGTFGFAVEARDRLGARSVKRLTIRVLG